MRCRIGVKNIPYILRTLQIWPICLLMAIERVPDFTLAIAQSLLTALRERDPYTYGHCRRVARNARLLAKAAGLSEKEQKIIEFSSLFHDLGKIGIPDNILLKPGRLTAEEAQIIRDHPVKSVEILKPLAQNDFLKATFAGVLHHHERIDGLGYPHRLVGDKIPLDARVILIVDTFDAMTTTRPYRKGLPIDAAIKELKNFAGRQFDAQLVKIFSESFAKWGDYQQEITEEFVIAKYKRAA